MKIAPNRSIHMTAIGGVGMAALAGLLTELGHRVRGSDLEIYPPASDELARLGVPVAKGYRAENLEPRPDIVVMGNTIPAKNPEAIAVRLQGIPTISLPEALASLFQGGTTGTPPQSPQQPNQPPPTGSENAAVARALAEAQAALTASQQALREGDFAKYGEEQAKLAAAIERAVAAQRAAAAPTPSPSPSATPSPSPTQTGTALGPP